jgi:hypothetical protein
MVTKAEQTGDKSNPRFIVTPLSMLALPARERYEELYCARGACENRIEGSAARPLGRSTLHCYLPGEPAADVAGLRSLRADACAATCRGLAGTALARACANTIRLRLLKFGAAVTVSVRSVKLALSEVRPHQREFIAAFHALGAAARQAALTNQRTPALSR